VPGAAADAKLTLENLPVATGMAKIEHLTIDADHSNAYAAWQRMGSPQHPTPQQYAELERAGQLAHGEPIAPIQIRDGVVTLNLRLPRQAVSLLVVHVGDGRE